MYENWDIFLMNETNNKIILHIVSNKTNCMTNFMANTLYYTCDENCTIL